MKKIILILLISTFGLTSCSEDKENSIVSEKIVGTWYQTASTEGEWNDCRKESIATFHKNGLFTRVSKGNDSGNCITESSITEDDNYKWEKVETDKYQIVKGKNKVPVTLKNDNLFIGVYPSTNYNTYKKK